MGAPLRHHPGRGASALLVAVGVVIGLAAAPVVGAVVKNGRGPLLWSVPGGVDTRPLDAVACPSATLCVAVDRGGSVLWSRDPEGGPGRWHLREVDGHEMTSVSCPSTKLCVAVDAKGDAITWQNPGGAGSSLSVASIDTTKTQNNTDNAGSVLLRGVACPTTSLCVAVDAAGNALVSLDPASPAATWTTTHIDNNRSYDCTGSGLTCQPPLVGVSCPSAQLCVAVDFSGNLLTTTDPVAPTPWSSTQTYEGGPSSLYGVSCPTTGFCATVDGDARRAITVNPATPGSQTSRLLPDSLYGIWCQSQSLCLASAETSGGISGLLGSFDPSAPDSSWSLSSLGGVDGIACPASSLCIAADDEGNIAAGATVTAITAELKSEILDPAHLPKAGAIKRTGRAQLKFTSPIAAQVSVIWTTGGPPGSRVMLASGFRRFYSAGTARVPVRLSAAGQRLFKTARGDITVIAKATFAASTGSIGLAKPLTFKR